MIFRLRIRPSHIATVLSELFQNIDENKLIMLAQKLGVISQIQRLGFVLEKIDVFEMEDKKEKIIKKLEEYLQNSDRAYVSLVPYISRTGCPRCKSVLNLKIIYRLLFILKYTTLFF